MSTLSLSQAVGFHLLLWIAVCTSPSALASEPPKPITLGRFQVVSLDQVMRARVQSFADVWSRGDVDAYVAFFVPDYAPTDRSHGQWLASRRRLVSAARQIHVQVTRIDVIPHPELGVMETNFDQLYRSSTYQDQVRKKLIWKQIRGQWRIAEESSRPLP